MEDRPEFMRRALELAALGRGRVEPNPMVGAVLVRGGAVVGEGYHEAFGGPHAEVNALARAAAAARGATLYVTLEPCCHRGKTGPCTDAIIAAGIARVVCAMTDPFGRVAGEGVRRLREAGIEVAVGLLEPEARRLNAPYLTLLVEGRPYVHAKWATTLDGKIATCAGDSRWISGPESRDHAHRLRGRVDAVVAGIGTVLADDPLLTARPPGPRTALRVVLDSSARLPTASRLVRTAREVPTLVVATDRAAPDTLRRLEQAGCSILVLPTSDRTAMVGSLLEELGRRRLTNVLVEGGGHVLGSFLDARRIDEVHVYLAPKLCGGATAPSPVAGRGFARIAEAPEFEPQEILRLGDDIAFRGHLRNSSAMRHPPEA